MDKPLKKHRYRVNVDIQVVGEDGTVHIEPHHVGIWDTEKQARAVLTGLDHAGLAFHYRHRDGYMPNGVASVVIAELTFHPNGDLKDQETIHRSFFTYGVAKQYEREKVSA